MRRTLAESTDVCPKFSKHTFVDLLVLWAILFGKEHSMRSLCPIEIFGSSRLTGSGLACLRARQGVPGELISEDVAAA